MSTFYTSTNSFRHPHNSFSLSFDTIQRLSLIALHTLPLTQVNVHRYCDFLEKLYSLVVVASGAKFKPLKNISFAVSMEVLEQPPYPELHRPSPVHPLFLNSSSSNSSSGNGSSPARPISGRQRPTSSSRDSSTSGDSSTSTRLHLLGFANLRDPFRYPSPGCRIIPLDSRLYGSEQVCVCVCVCVRGHRARADVVVLTATMKSEGANTRATTLV